MTLLRVFVLTRGNADWGFIVRRGRVEITKHDVGVIAQAMGADTLVG